MQCSRRAVVFYLPLLGKRLRLRRSYLAESDRVHGPSGLARKVVRIREFGKEGLAVGATVVGEL
jgi:hypothetical protein